MVRAIVLEQLCANRRGTYTLVTTGGTAPSPHNVAPRLGTTTADAARTAIGAALALSRSRRGILFAMNDRWTTTARETKPDGQGQSQRREPTCHALSHS